MFRISNDGKKPLEPVAMELSNQKPSLVSVPASSTTRLQLSTEQRRQLRLTKHQAFTRHQRNAQWTREVLESGFLPKRQPRTFEEDGGRLEVLRQENQALEEEISSIRKNDDLQLMLEEIHAASDVETIEALEHRIRQEKEKSHSSNATELEIVAL